jgi:hypothetical protein
VWDDEAGRERTMCRRSHREYYDLIIAVVAGEETLDA